MTTNNKFMTKEAILASLISKTNVGASASTLILFLEGEGVKSPSPLFSDKPLSAKLENVLKACTQNSLNNLCKDGTIAALAKGIKAAMRGQTKAALMAFNSVKLSKIVESSEFYAYFITGGKCPPVLAKAKAEAEGNDNAKAKAEAEGNDNAKAEAEAEGNDNASDNGDDNDNASDNGDILAIITNSGNLEDLLAWQKAIAKRVKVLKSTAAQAA